MITAGNILQIMEEQKYYNRDVKRDKFFSTQQDFHNKVIKNRILLDRLVMNDKDHTRNIIIDLACGKGGDILMA